jgi:hypothetical protein
MSREDSFIASKASFGILGGFFKDTSKEIGEEKALELYGKQGSAFGEMLAGVLKEKLSGKQLDMKTFASVTKDAMNGFGFNYEMDETPELVKVTVHKCPFYEAYKEAGLDEGTIEAMCKKMSSAEYSQLEKTFPGLKAGVTFRPQPDVPCIEEFHLKK